MVDLTRFLELTPDEARQQWRRIVQRDTRARQEAFLPVEVLLTYTLFFVLDPHRYGGANIGKVPIEAKSLAATLRRTPGSITSKMLNLDGSRRNCARAEPELFLRLSTEPDRAAVASKPSIGVIRPAARRLLLLYSRSVRVRVRKNARSIITIPLLLMDRPAPPSKLL